MFEGKELCEEGGGEEKRSVSKNTVEYLCSLSGSHSKTVNVVRFSPDGNAIASAGDSGEVVLWRKQDTHKTKGEGTERKKEQGEEEERKKKAAPRMEGTSSAPSSWKAVGALRGQADDVQDLAWSPDGTALVTGSIENVAYLWDAGKQRSLARLEGHHHYIQGVAWDPQGEYIITQSGDRSCRVYSPKPLTKRVLAKGDCVGLASRIHACGVSVRHVLVRQEIKPKLEQQQQQQQQQTKREEEQADGGFEKGGEHLPSSSAACEDDPATTPPKEKKQKVERQTQSLFHDENMPSFFRRLSWSPDGSFLACPAGLYRRHTDSKLGNCVHIFKRGLWSKPLLTLPALSKAVVGVKFCPILFEHRKEEAEEEGRNSCKERSTIRTSGLGGEVGEDKKGKEEKATNVFDLPYRIYFAVITLNSVILYETGVMKPVALVSGLHCASLTDLAWSPDGRKIAVSSHDGYCSLITFSEGELGKPVDKAVMSEIMPSFVWKGIERKEKTPLKKTSAEPGNAAAPSPGPAPAITPLKQINLKDQTVQIITDSKTNTVRKRIAPMPIR